MNDLSITAKLSSLRQRMKHHEIDAFIAMSADPHMSEYLPDYWKIREWLTGFTGSVGTIVVTQEYAGLWVDGRYWVQAEHQLDGTGFQLGKLSNDPNSTHLSWLIKHLNPSSRISVNTQTISIQQFDTLAKIAQQNDFKIVEDTDLIGEIWKDRPILPSSQIYEQNEKINSLSRQEKIAKVREDLQRKSADAHFISSVDDIAWILNCRGADVEYNPVFLSHLLITHNQTILFIDSNKIPTDLLEKFQSERIEIIDYEKTGEYLVTLRHRTILIDSSKCSYYHLEKLKQNNRIIEDINPSTLLKACKQPSEIQHIRHAMLKDGIALVTFSIGSKPLFKTMMPSTN